MIDAEDIPRKWFFTFPLSSSEGMFYVELYGTWKDTRDEMMRIFGSHWAFQYPSAEDAGVEDFGLKRLSLAGRSPLDADRFKSDGKPKLFLIKGEK